MGIWTVQGVSEDPLPQVYLEVWTYNDTRNYRGRIRVSKRMLGSSIANAGSQPRDLRREHELTDDGYGLPLGPADGARCVAGGKHRTSAPEINVDGDATRDNDTTCSRATQTAAFIRTQADRSGGTLGSKKAEIGNPIVVTGP